MSCSKCLRLRAAQVLVNTTNCSWICQLLFAIWLKPITENLLVELYKKPICRNPDLTLFLSFSYVSQWSRWPAPRKSKVHPWIDERQPLGSRNTSKIWKFSENSSNLLKAIVPNFSMCFEKFGTLSSKWAMGKASIFDSVRLAATWKFFWEGHKKMQKTGFFCFLSNYLRIWYRNPYPGYHHVKANVQSFPKIQWIWSG